jgi:hypothetical protein
MQVSRCSSERRVYIQPVLIGVVGLQKGAKPDVYDWLADSDDEPDKEPQEKDPAQQVVQDKEGRKKKSPKAVPKTTRTAKGKVSWILLTSKSAGASCQMLSAQLT